MNKEKKDAFENAAKHFEEPLFAISLFVFFASIARSFLDKATSDYLVAIMFVSSVASIYFIYLYFKSGKKDYYSFGIPVLALITTLFSWYAGQKSGWDMRDFMVFSIVFGIFLLFYALMIHKILKPGAAAIFAIFLSALLIHTAPAFTFSWAPWSGKYIAEITDPYFYYRHAKFVVENGYSMEIDKMTYPTAHINHGWGLYFQPVLIASIALVLSPLNMDVYNIDLLSGGIFAAFSVLLLYILIKNLFYDMRPYNRIAAILAAFMLMLSPAFASKAIATNSEDDAMGMFLFISSFSLFAIAMRKKSILFSILSGIAFLFLHITWNGYAYALLMFGIFAAFYAIINFIHKKNCVEHIPYFIIPMIMSNLSFLFIHPRGELPPISSLFSLSSLMPFIGPVIIAFLLEVIRSRLYGKLRVEGTSTGNKLENFIQDNIFPLGGFILFAGLLSLFFINPTDILNYISSLLSVKVARIIAMTTAEQNPMCSTINADCILRLNSSFGIGLLFGLAMIPILAYFMLSRRSMGAVFVLSWALPMLYGVISKSQYQFMASVPIIAMGSTIGLIVAASKKDLESLRVIPLIVLVSIPLFMSIGSSMPILKPFGGATQMQYGGSNEEAIYWDPTLQWLKTTPNDTVILTWWDYGHIITAVSNRVSMADNLKGVGYIVQDLARFHVLETNETKALDIARKYSADYVIIDWTMIGKSAAPHFIATSNLTTNEPGESEGYGQCGFSPQNSLLKPKLVPNSKGGFDSIKKVVFMCNIAGPYEEYIGAIIFDISNDKLTGTTVSPVTATDRGLILNPPIPWETWKKEHNASILGIQSPRDIIGNSLNYGTDRYIGFQTFNTLVYVPEKFNDYMMTKLYLGDHMEEYRQFGLTDINRLEHFNLVDGFLGDKQDNSYYGYVKAYKINYPEMEDAGNSSNINSLMR